MRDNMLQTGSSVDIQAMLAQYESQDNHRRHISSTSTLKGFYAGGGKASLASNDESLRNEHSVDPMKSASLHKPVIQTKPRPMTATNFAKGKVHDRWPNKDVKEFLSQNFLRG